MTMQNHLFDALEPRRMMSAALSGTTLNLRGTPQADNFSVRRRLCVQFGCGPQKQLRFENQHDTVNRQHR